MERYINDENKFKFWEKNEFIIKNIRNNNLKQEKKWNVHKFKMRQFSATRKEREMHNERYARQKRREKKTKLQVYVSMRNVT